MTDLGQLRHTPGRRPDFQNPNLRGVVLLGPTVQTGTELGTMEQRVNARMIVLHSVWTEGQLHFWAESAKGAAEFVAPVDDLGDDDDTSLEEESFDQPEAEDEQTIESEDEGGVAVQVEVDLKLADHPFAVDSQELRDWLKPFLTTEPGEGRAELRLPAQGGRALPSARLAHASGIALADRGADGLGLFGVETLVVDAEQAPFVLERIEEHASNTSGEDGLLIGRAVDYLSLVGRFSRRLLAQHRFVPGLRQNASGELDGAWQAWFADEQSAEDASILVSAMPPAVRAVVDGREHDPASVFNDMVTDMVDAGCRRALIADDLPEVLDGRDTSDPSVSWLTGLLGDKNSVDPSDRRALIKDVRSWIGRLEDRGSSTEWRLCLRLNEPIMLQLPEDEEGDEMRPSIMEPNDALWSLSFHLQPTGAQEVIVDAADIWLLSSESVTIEGRRIDSPQELLLAELGRASRLYKPLERALDETEPVDLGLKTNEAYEFLREIRPLLREQGFGVIEPGWFGSSTSRLGAKLLLDSDPMEDPLDPANSPTVAGASQLGLDALVGYQWQIAVGDVTLSLKEFEELAERKTPLVQINGKWVEIRPEDVEAAIKFIRENPGGEMSVGEAIRMAFGADARTSGLHVTGLETTGWLADVFGGSAAGEALPILNQPVDFQGTLRPYQLRGYSWLAFLERFGFGACLADDMGLGKTIQMLAIMSGEREEAKAKGIETVPPTLLIAPTSVVGNWVRETERFCPHLNVMVHHGPTRLSGNEFIERVAKADLVVTTYALANRDQDLLTAIQWGRLVLDEAQFIKNPAAKQAQAVRQINAKSRFALTGTPVENRLSELWSIMDFLNPGYLGTPGTFRKKFAVPIEKYRDDGKSMQLRSLVRPFVLRRLKSDPKVVGDLPPKVESREYCHLTSEQAELYEQTVKKMLSDVDATEGIRRRGIVLSALVKLKQICNHPAQALKEYVKGSTTPPSPARSGKTTRIIEMLDEIMAAGDQALIFSQFRQMGHILATTLRHSLDREVLFLHGGTPRLQRQKLVDEFQKADGSAPIMLVSLRAGGVGLNLTAANHVFHFDRWWNPAVENQATDRAYRIGQTRTVQVHKFVCRGTLEERIDEMLETKSQLAEQIVGSGEQWLTELDTDALRDLLTLRGDAVGVE